MAEDTQFKAWQVSEQDGEFRGEEVTRKVADLPEHDVLIKVHYSSLNYKDALSASGNRAVTREYPHTPGIDAFGDVVSSADDRIKVGQHVIVTGYDLGMNTDGGFGEYIRVPAAWCVPMPDGWDGLKAMTYGTAGLTAGLCVSKILMAGAKPEQGKVAVTGATGAVGSVCVELLAGLGFDVVAISGKADQQSLLNELGAQEVVGRETLTPGNRPLLKPAYANAIDTVGGAPLAELLKQIQPGGSVACCGLVAGAQLETTVLPFILRGVNLLGVDSVEIPLEDKVAVWEMLSGEWACPVTEQHRRTIGRAELAGSLSSFLKGESVGKVVLDHSL
ncbi:YhdH/YhfP family quinone oxidoreductase [Marinobacter zhejiangensis]|uniref:Putative quinone oxidoreductase, YhdH/YhfP family n=1 Tax=Marinobacter zhejiangensis TaxID=488535 RepID=A0A1I4RV17_9GAMM|nr:YhdH/YhfP family quinone oxidoreductase [Marinobacter zhejiangensis]SFM56085.1 putative quinone oxidoreductase, YhdH/YhfP family [Marinobacter zhejiangensis]